MSQVFLSYSRQDEPTARRVAKALTAAGHDVWWDADLPAHRSYSDVIETHLKDAKAVVVLWSASAAQSQWVRAEADYARNAGKLVQAQLDGSLPPMPFNQIQCADLKGWRGSAKHPGWAKLQASVASLVSGEEAPSAPPPERVRWWNIPQARWLAAAGALLLLLAAFLVPRFIAGGEEEKPVVAVLPFESLDARDESLVAGIWEDTRQAIGRNPQLLVLGPNTAEEIAEKGSGTARKLADYLVEASVRSVGDRIRVSANLVRTDDGTEVWNKSFDRRLDDVFALQSEIAGEIEGHIRGRLAERGGMLPENIATSGEVYALYSDARASIRGRRIAEYEAAVEKLRRVVKMDPNFAPGWATLSVAQQFTLLSAGRNESSQSEAYARRAIALAPNLGTGHAALALALGIANPVAEPALRKALSLDPNDIEAMNWLATNASQRADYDEALQLYDRIVTIEPLWWPAILNKVNLLLDLGDNAAAQQELERLKARDPSERMLALATVTIAKRSGDLSSAAAAGLNLLNSRPDVDADMVRFGTFEVLMQLGYEDEGRAVAPPPPFGPLLWKDDPRGLDMVKALNLPPAKFFIMGPLPMNAGRVYVLSGRGAELAQLYREAASSPEELANIMTDFGFVEMAPFIALGLRSAGDTQEAARVLTTANTLAAKLRPDRRPSVQALLARVHAVEGRNAEALQGLISAVNRDWLPGLPALKNDIAVDPAFASIKSDPRFERVRQQILGHLRKERAELGPVVVKYPTTRRSP